MGVLLYVGFVMFFFFIMLFILYFFKDLLLDIYNWIIKDVLLF